MAINLKRVLKQSGIKSKKAQNNILQQASSLSDAQKNVILRNIRLASDPQAQSAALNNVTNFLAEQSTSIGNKITQVGGKVSAAVKNLERTNANTAVEHANTAASTAISSNPFAMITSRFLPSNLLEDTRKIISSGGSGVQDRVNKARNFVVNRDLASANIEAAGTVPRSATSMISNQVPKTSWLPKDIADAGRTQLQRSQATKEARREARLVAESPIHTNPNEIAREHGFELDANGKIISPATEPQRLTLEQVEDGKRRSSDFLRSQKEAEERLKGGGLTEKEWRQKYGPTVEFGDVQAAQDMEERMETLAREKAEREAVERERLDQQRFDREASRVDTENDNLNHAHQALYAGPSEEKLEQMLKEAEAAEAKGILPFEQQLKEMNARADKRLQVKNANKEGADSIPASLEDLEKLPQPTPVTNMFKEAQEKAKVEQKAAEQRRLDSMTPEERGKYLQEQREAEAATRAGQRKAARTLEEEPGGISYIGAEGGKEGINGYENVYLDKDDVTSMLMEKYGESMGSKGAIKYMVDNVQKDLNKGFEKIMSSNSKDKRKEVDELIGGLAARIDDGPGLGDYIMGNKLHTGAIGLAAMAGTMGVAFGGHKSNAELYSSPF